MADTKPSVLKISPTQYRERVSRLRCPSLLQAHAFAEHVAAAHSWYKHLPVKSGYGGFGFYLDPNAGKDIWQDVDGKIRIVTRLPEDTPFHYSWMTTAATIENFAYVNYCRYRPGQSALPWIVDGTELMSVPDELLQLTYAECSALIHPHSQSLRHMLSLQNFRQLIDIDVAEGLQAPEEKRLAEILRIADDDDARVDDLKNEFAGIVAAARNQQIAGMVKAICQLEKFMSGENRYA